MPDPRSKPVPVRPLSTSLLARVRAALASHPRVPRDGAQIVARSDHERPGSRR